MMPRLRLSLWRAMLVLASSLAGCATSGTALSTRLPAAVHDLPLIIVPTTGMEEGPWMAVFLSGDGGWAGLDKGVSKVLASHGIPVVGWNSLNYFWTRRTPQGAAHDLDRVVRFYSRAWNRTRVLLIGFSQGADTMPFMFNGLAADTHALVDYAALIAISDNALWEFHLETWFGNPLKGTPTAPEVERWSGAPYVCIYGESDADAACNLVTHGAGTVVAMAGGHHFNGAYAAIAQEILRRLPEEPAGAVVRPR